LNNQETESHSLSGGGTLNLGLQKPKVGDQQLGLSRNNLPPQNKKTNTPHDKNNCKSFLPSKLWKCTSHAMQTRGSTLQDSPPQPPHDANSKPTTSATTSVENKYRTPAKYAASKDPSERTKKSGKQKHTHTKGFFLSTMLCLDYDDDYYYYYDDDIIAEKDVLRFIDPKKKT